MPARGRPKREVLALLPALAMAAVASLLGAVTGDAACHSFTVGVSPGSVNEGSGTTATISRDGNYNPSSVQVDSVDGSAVAGRDYVAIHQRLSFTTETSLALPVTTIHNPAHEGSQAFRIQLSGGMGCQVNPNFAYGPAATVTVLDTDPAPAATPTPAHPAGPPPPMTAHPAATAPPAPAPSPVAQGAAPTPTSAPASTPSPSPSGSLSPGPTPVLAASPASSGGSGSPGPLVLAGVVVSALAGGALYWYRRRSVA